MEETVLMKDLYRTRGGRIVGSRPCGGCGPGSVGEMGVDTDTWFEASGCIFEINLG